MPQVESFKRSEVKKAVDKISNAVPDAVFEEWNYGFATAVARADKSKAFHISDVIRDRDGKYLAGYLANDEEVDLIIEGLKE